MLRSIGSPPGPGNAREPPATEFYVTLTTAMRVSVEAARMGAGITGNAALDLPPLALPVLALTLLALAGAAWRLLRTLAVSRPEAAAVALALATMLLDQGDALWLAPSLMLLDAAIRRRHVAMLGWFGLALALDPQAALVSPFVAAVLIARRARVALWLVALAVTAPLALDLSQREGFPALTHGAPNLWFIAATLLPADAPRLVGLALAGAAGASACLIAHFSARLPAGRRMLPVALLATLGAGGLLPGMPRHGFVLAGLIAWVWALATRERHACEVAVFITAGTAFAIGGGAFTAIGAVCVALGCWRVAVPAVRPAANDNPLLMPTFRHPPVPPRPVM